VNSRLHGL